MNVIITKTISGCLFSYTKIIEKVLEKGNYKIEKASSESYYEFMSGQLITNISIELDIPDD